MEAIDMTTTVHTTTKITPWDDVEFVRTYEGAREAAHQAGLGDGPAAGAEVQRRLREAGFTMARVDVVRTAKEAIDQVSHWFVDRGA
jgi:hypothetical protein